MFSNPFKPSVLDCGTSPELAIRQRFPFSSVGPVTGAVVGLAQGTATAITWGWYGQPDIIFRNATAAVFTSLLLFIAGSVFGFCYAPILILFSRVAQRNVRPIVHIVTGCVASFAYSTAAAIYAFENDAIISPFIVLSAVVTTTFLVAVFSSFQYAT